MSQLNIIDIAKHDLYTTKSDLESKYPLPQIEHLLRLRDMVTWCVANPDMKDRQFVDELRSRYGLSQVTAYADLKIVKALLPNLSECTRDFHRWRYNEMIMETYQMAKKRKDTKTMEKAATSYAKFNRIDIEDEQSVPYHMIVVQPFFPLLTLVSWASTLSRTSMTASANSRRSFPPLTPIRTTWNMNRLTSFSTTFLRKRTQRKNRSTNKTATRRSTFIK